MVSQTQACYTASDGRRPYSRPYPLYFPSSERRGYPSPLSSHSHDVHHARSLSAMTDPQLDSNSGTPQRKRIAVAVSSKLNCFASSWLTTPDMNSLLAVYAMPQAQDTMQWRSRTRPAMLQLQERRRGAMSVSPGTVFFLFVFLWNPPYFINSRF